MNAAAYPDRIHQFKPPVAIGGIGGSGTRLIAQCLKELGFYLGGDLNQANDNLWFVLLFNLENVLSTPKAEFDVLADLFHQGMTGGAAFTPDQASLVGRLAASDRKRFSAQWLKERAESFLAARPPLDPEASWGWKNPNTHVMVDRLRDRYLRLKYIHVVRNGLDMAHSRNQNQLKIWGPLHFGRDFTVSPYYSLKYWCLVHRRIRETGRAMGADFLWLDYDDFCSRPGAGIEALGRFLRLDRSDSLDRLPDLIQPPDSIGRFRQFGTRIFDPADVAYVGELGFETS